MWRSSHKLGTLLMRLFSARDVSGVGPSTSATRALDYFLGVSRVSQWLFAGLGPAIVAIIAACGTLLGVPIYFWVADRRRRGEPVRLVGLLGPIFIGGVGVVAVLLFLLVGRR